MSETSSNQSYPLGQDPELLDLDRPTAIVDALLATAESDAWDRPTPCSDWDLRDVTNHLVAGARIMTAGALGQAQPGWDGDYLGDEPVKAFRESASAFRGVMSEPGALEKMSVTILGHEPGSSLVRMRISELVVHGWDLARALGQPTDLVPDLAGQLLAFWQAGIGDIPRGAMPFDEVQSVPDDATAADRLAAYLGRRV